MPRPTPPLPQPWTARQLERIIEDAARFIAAARARHGRKLGLAVGEYLYVHIYRRDDAYLGSRSPDKGESMKDLAKRTGHSPTTLRQWIVAAATRMKLAQLGFESDRMDFTDFLILYGLRDHPATALEVARWVDREDPSVDDVRAFVRKLRGRREPGDDPVPVKPPGPRKRRGRKPRRRRTDEELALLRVMTLVRGWLVDTRLSPARRAELVAILEELRRLVVRRRVRP